MDAQEISTVLSDCLLAFSAFVSAGKLYTVSTWSAIAFLIIGFAALAGAARFSGYQWPANLPSIHRFLFWAVNAVAVPLIAVGYLVQANQKNVAVGFLLAPVIMLCARMKANLKESLLSKLTWIVVFASFAACIYVCSMIKFSIYGLTGAALYSVASVVTSEGYFGPIPRVDIFHYLLTIGNLALMFGLLNA